VPSTPCPPAESWPTIAGRDGLDVDVDGLSWRPLRRRTAVLRDLDLHIPAGQRVLLAGPSGAGKSTLLRAIAGLLLTAGDGDLGGRVLVGGREPADVPGGIGLLLQDPTAAIVAETVGRDVAFGLENHRVPRDLIWPRVVRALEEARFPYGVDHATGALSGGETQRLALAGSLVLDAGVLLLDEPTSMLDSAAAAAVRTAIRRSVEDRGTTTVVVAHHLEPWLDFADRLVVLDGDGSLLADGPPSAVLHRHGEGLAAAGVWVPGIPAPAPLALPAGLVGPWRPAPDRLLTAEDVRVELPGSLVDRAAAPTVALAAVDAVLDAGRTLAVTGPSGAGKSTLVAVLAGLLRPTGGRVVADPALGTRRGVEPWRWTSPDLTARLSWVPQTPEHGVVAATVRDEVLASARACRRDAATASARASGLLEALGLDRIADASPYHLSGGEQRRLMVAAALAHGPYGVLLDKPTVSQDRNTWAAVLGCIHSARSAGAAVGLASHDLSAVDAVADERLELCAGAPA